jgi:hypothetical protein
MNDEVESVWKRTVMAHSKYIQAIRISVRRGSAEPVRTSLELAGALAGSRSFHLPNKSLELYPAPATNITMMVTGPLC